MTRRESKRRRLLVETMRQAGQLPGVAAASVRAILEREAARPLFGPAQDMQRAGLFGDAHTQKELSL